MQVSKIQEQTMKVMKMQVMTLQVRKMEVTEHASDKNVSIGNGSN